MPTNDPRVIDPTFPPTVGIDSEMRVHQDLHEEFRRTAGRRTAGRALHAEVFLRAMLSGSMRVGPRAEGSPVSAEDLVGFAFDLADAFAAASRKPAKHIADVVEETMRQVHRNTGLEEAALCVERAPLSATTSTVARCIRDLKTDPTKPAIDPYELPPLQAAGQPRRVEYPPRTSTCGCPGDLYTKHLVSCSLSGKAAHGG